MAEPTIEMQVNENTEGSPTWVAIDTAIRWVGAGAAQESLAVAFAAPVGDGDEAFFDGAASPNDGVLWHEKAGASNDIQVVGQGRNANRNVIRVEETGGSDATSDPPEFTAYDDATDAGNRTDPSVWFLAGTTGSSNISCTRAVETTSAAGSAGGWQAQIHDEDPQTTGTGVAADGYALDGNKSGEKVVTAAVLALSGTKTFNVAACAPHDSTAGLTSFVYCLQYTYQ